MQLRFVIAVQKAGSEPAALLLRRPFIYIVYLSGDQDTCISKLIKMSSVNKFIKVGIAAS